MPGSSVLRIWLSRINRHHSDRLAGPLTPFRRRDNPGSRCPVIQFKCIIAQDMTYCNGENLRHSPRLDISRCISYIVPMYDVLEQRYQRQMAELERQQVQQKLADVLGLCPAGSRSEEARAFIDAIYLMNRALGIPERFPCIRPEDLPQMAAWAEAEANPVYPVPVIFGKEDFIRVARRVMP